MSMVVVACSDTESVSMSVIILSSIGISILISKILKGEHKPTGVVTKISFLAIITALLLVPMAYPELNWSNSNALTPITILNSSTSFDISTNDWSDSMQWLKENTPEDAVIAAWWDYGYWISTLSERKTLADNATLLDYQVRKLAAMYMSTPDHAWQILTSDTETYVGSYYVTLPSNPSEWLFDEQPTFQQQGNWGEDGYLEQSKLDGFRIWKDDSTAQANIDHEKVSNYATLFDYWTSEIYEIPPILTGLDADYILIDVQDYKGLHKVQA